MPKIASFNPTALSSIRADMVAALAAVEAKYGIKIGLGKINYTDSDFTCKMTTMIADTVSYDLLMASRLIRNGLLISIAATLLLA